MRAGKHGRSHSGEAGFPPSLRMPDRASDFGHVGTPDSPLLDHLDCKSFRAAASAPAMSTPAPVPQLTKDHGKLVLTVALTGNLNTKEKNPNLPCSPQEIADDVHACAELGCAGLGCAGPFEQAT